MVLEEGASLTAVYGKFTLYVRGERNGVSAHLVDREQGNISGRWSPPAQPTTVEEAKQVLLTELNQRPGITAITSLDWLHTDPPPPAAFGIETVR